MTARITIALVAVLLAAPLAQAFVANEAIIMFTVYAALALYLYHPTTKG